MKKILFPTDSSELSKNAFEYALNYARKAGAKLLVYHVYDESVSHSEELKDFYERIDIENFKNGEDIFPVFDAIVEEKGYGDVEIDYLVDKGSFVDSIRCFVEAYQEKLYLVIMGTHGTSRLMELFTKSNTLRVLESIDQMVMAVPEKAVFDGNIDNIAFLVDYKDDEKTPLKKFVEKAQIFNAKLHVLHFDVAHTESITDKMDDFKATVSNEGYDNVAFESIDSIDVKKSLKDYCEAQKIDVVCVVNRSRDFYQRMFYYSLSEELINSFNIPVLAVQGKA